MAAVDREGNLRRGRRDIWTVALSQSKLTTQKTILLQPTFNLLNEYSGNEETRPRTSVGVTETGLAYGDGTPGVREDRPSGRGFDGLVKVGLEPRPPVGKVLNSQMATSYPPPS